MSAPEPLTRETIGRPCASLRERAKVRVSCMAQDRILHQVTLARRALEASLRQLVQPPRP